MGTISLKTAEKIKEAWPHARSLTDAMSKAGLNGNERNLRRYRRQAEDLLGIELPSINPRFSSSARKLECPSTLSLPKARKKKKYIVTSCTSNTAINHDFLDALEQLASDNDAQIIIIPTRYKNPEKIFEEKEYVWHQRTHKYILKKDFKVNSTLSILNKPISPTKKHPLSGIKAVSGIKSAVYGHPQVSLQTAATPANEESKIIMTTGTISEKDYSSGTYGTQADFHHSFGATYIHVDGKNFHPLQLNWSEKTKDFYFLNKRYTKEGSSDSFSVPSLIQGDSHAVWQDKGVLKARKRLMSMTSPESLVWHDLHDHKYKSHHATTVEKIHMAMNNEFLVEKELNISLKLLEDFGQGVDNYIIGSNHNDHLDKWLWKHKDEEDPHNALFVSKLKTTVIESKKPAFEAWIKEKLTVNAIFPSRGKACLVKDIDISQHGDVGGNGSRASARQFADFQRKVVVGHSHCLTADHEVLIKDHGWVNISDVQEGYEVLSYKKGQNEYVNVDEVFKFEHTGSLITLGGYFWRQTVTDKHNMFLKDGSYIPVSEAIVTKKASDIPISAKPIVSNGVDIDKNIISKIVSVCADGSFQDGKWVRFHLKKERKLKRLQDIFKNDILQPKVGYNGAKKVSLKTGSKSYLEVVNFIDGNNKCLPDSFLNLSTECKEHFIDELKYWDGRFDKGSNGCQWTTSKKSEANLVSQILTELGYRNTCKLKGKSKHYSGIYLLTWCSDRDKIFHSERKNVYDKARIEGWGVNTKKVEKEPVFCLSNKNKNFWVRNTVTGQVSLTGNSPCIEKSCYQVGTSTKKMGYSKRGYSSWAICDCIIYENGKRTLLFYIKNKTIADFYN